MPPISPLYRAAVALGTLVAPAAARTSVKAARGHRGRIGAARRLIAWGRASRDAHRPLVWMHAPSVGEGWQAASVLDAFRRLVPDTQVVYTHFSPSAARFAAGIGADIADYLPYDTPRTARRLLAALRPDLLVFAKLDLWPELATQASGRGVPVALVAATVRPNSGRLRLPARRLLMPGYAAVAAAAAVGFGDRDRLVRLGVAFDRIRVSGDPRADSVLARLRNVRPDDPLLDVAERQPALVAGSTWPPDEEVLLAAYARIRRHHPDARLVIVPHEPTREHLLGVERRAEALGLPRPARLSEGGTASPLLLVDRLGALATLYGAGTMAYVGGGFGRAGLHSVLEPAAWGIPVAFGPLWHESRDAALLVTAAGGAGLTPTEPDEAARDLSLWWEQWLTDEPARAAAGKAAREAVEHEAGAAAENAAMLVGLLEARNARGGARRSAPA